jgi:Flp pilus assembly protein CpaB
MGRARRPAVVATVPLAAGMILTTQLVEEVQVPEGSVAPGTLFRASDVDGRQLVRPKQKGETLVKDDLGAALSERNNSLSTIIPEGRVLTTLTLENLTIPQKELRRGDRVDILVSGLSPEHRRAARVIVRDAYVVGYVTPPRANEANNKKNLLGVDLSVAPHNNSTGDFGGLLLALKPKDVIPVVEVDGAGAHLSIVLHGRSEVESGQMLAIDNPRTAKKTVDVIAGASRQEVIVP